MLDTPVDRIRVDDLREFIEARKRAAEDDRIEALDRDLQNVVSKKTGEIEAYEEALYYLDAKSGECDR